MKETNNIFLWLAVYEDGREIISRNQEGLQRFYPLKFRLGDSREINKIVSYDASKETCNIWIEYHSPEKLDKVQAIYPNWMFVPKGTIKKIIGRDLTWDDEPVKYCGN